MKFGSPANSSRVDDGVAFASAAGVAGTGGVWTREADPSRDGGTAEGAPFGEVRWAGRRAATSIGKRASIRGQGSDPKTRAPRPPEASTGCAIAGLAITITAQIELLQAEYQARISGC